MYELLIFITQFIFVIVVELNCILMMSVAYFRFIFVGYQES